MATPTQHRPTRASSTIASRAPEGDVSALVADLRRPEAYPSPCPRDVELRSTHASWVFLTEREAWKVKRPVNYGFLDYSDVHKRRRACADELALGERLAPDVYRDVAPIYLTPHGHSFVGPGAVVDHAVRMKRLDDEDSARTLLTHGRLAPEHLRKLASHLADFYAQALQTPAFGRPALLAADITDNYEQTRPYFDRFIDGDLAQSLYHWQQGFVFAEESRFLERQTAGAIREGHGDLRLEHVYFPPEPNVSVLVIDPIEFNAHFRCLDRALDVAFLAMELDAGGRSDLSALFLSRFAQATDDYGFYPVLDLYLSYRAWVRAKVACFIAADHHTDARKAKRKASEAHRLLDLAASYCHPERRHDQVIAIGGLIGAGKSTLADRLSAELCLPVVSSDVTRKHLAGLRPRERGTLALYTEAHTARTYEGMVHRARSVLDSGRGVILDATFATPTLRAMVGGLANDKQRRFLFVELDTDDETLRGRLTARTGAPTESDAREALLPDARRRFRPATELAASERQPLDASLPIDTLVRRVRERL